MNDVLFLLFLFIHFKNSSLFWNQQSILVWFGTIILADIDAIIVFSLSGTFLSFFVSFYEYHKVFLWICEDLMQVLNQQIKKQDRCAIKRTFCEFLNYNIIGKE